MFPEFSSLVEFLVWAASTSGALFLSGLFVAYVLERFLKWRQVPHDIKSIIAVAIAVGVSYGAKSLLSLNIIVGNPELNQIMCLFAYYYGNQLGYKKYFKTV